MPSGPFSDIEQLRTRLTDRLTADPGTLLYAAFVKAADGGEEVGQLAGLGGYSESDPLHASTEVGFIVSFSSSCPLI